MRLWGLPSFAVLVCAMLLGCGSEQPRQSRSANAPGPFAPPGATPATPTTAGAACGRPDDAPVVPQRWQFSSSMPNPRCDELATIWSNVAHSDRVCTTDADCALVTGDGNCWTGALNTRASARPEYREGPCGNPASGACAGHTGAARCVNGCCQVQ